HRVALGTAARVPRLRRVIAVEVATAVVVVVLFAAEDDAVADEGSQPAHVGVVGGADPGKGGVVAILVAVDLLPAAIRVYPQRGFSTLMVAPPHRRGPATPPPPARAAFRKSRRFMRGSTKPTAAP